MDRLQPCAGRRYRPRRRPRDLVFPDADSLVMPPTRIEDLAACDPTPTLDALLDLLDDPATPPSVRATIRDWLDS